MNANVSKSCLTPRVGGSTTYLTQALSLDRESMDMEITLTLPRQDQQLTDHLGQLFLKIWDEWFFVVTCVLFAWIMPRWVHRQKIEAPAAARSIISVSGLMRCQKPRRAEGLSNRSSRFSSPHTTRGSKRQRLVPF